MTYCKQCLNKQQNINDLEEEIVSLKTKLRYQERTAKKNINAIGVVVNQVIKGMA